LHPEYNFKSHYARIDGHRLHYIDEGQGPVIVAVHGNPTWSFYYRNVIKYLRNNFRVIALDHMGCGYSDKPQEYDYTLSRHIENLTKLLNSLDINKCSLMVHDWGGAIGMGFAVRNSEKIEKIVVLNTAAFRSQRIPFRIALCRWPLLGQFLVRGLNGFAWPATFMAVVRPMDGLTKKYYLRPYDSWKNRIAVHGFVMDIPLDASHPSYGTLLEIEEGLGRIKEKKIPLLVLWGGKDFCFTREFYQQWKSLFPDAEAHYFDNLGHYILEDGYEIIRPHLNSFFNLNVS